MANTSQVTNLVLVIRCITIVEARVRREKGLCYHCNEWFTSFHKYDDDEPELKATRKEIKEGEDLDEAPQISLHAINFGNNKTLSSHHLNSGSTHNYIDPIIIRRTQTQSNATFEVMVANGEGLKGNRRCKVLLHS
ncbi:hypothetical protein AMTRI_Chr03g140950 [Amborella trichopoda]